MDLRKIFNDVYNTASVRHTGLIQMVEVNVSINIPDKSYILTLGTIEYVSLAGNAKLK